MTPIASIEIGERTYSFRNTCQCRQYQIENRISIFKVSNAVTMMKLIYIAYDFYAAI